jgi:hypothetical protein
MKAYRARAAEVCVRLEPKTMTTLDSIAEEIGYSRNELMQSMVKFGLTNRDWRNEGLTAHKRLPRYQENPMATKPPSPAQLAARARFAEMASSGVLNRKRQIAAKKKAAAAAPKANPRKKTVSEKISQLVHEGYPQRQAVAVALNEQRKGKVKRNPASGLVKGYAVVCMHPNPHTVAITTSMSEAKKIGQDYATRENVQVAIKPVDVHAGHFA